MNHFSEACGDFELSAWKKKMNVLEQDVDVPLIITFDDYELEVVNLFL